ncbi:MAG: low-specificity L-threonine aldolase [Pseudohongiellaceae bacterium]
MNKQPQWIDLRSDTVTRPTPAMRQAMHEAVVGDDVYGEDPTVRELEDTLARMTGKQAGLFMPSGTQSNLVALLTHCGRGDEYIAAQDAHTYRYEGGGAAVLGGIQPQPVPARPEGGMDLAAAQTAIKPVDFHFARSRLLCIENTTHGQALPLDYMEAARALADRNGLALHLDGARLFNAAIALGHSVEQLTGPVDTVSICLSKGLGAPVGSVLLGPAQYIEQARRWRKVTGGGLRQAGILAAAGLYALEHHVERLAEDHRRAGVLAEALEQLGFPVQRTPTNMVFLDGSALDAGQLQSTLEQSGIRLDADEPEHLRLVTHLDISDEDIEQVVAAFRAARDQ